MASILRRSTGEGNITIHWTQEKTERLIKEDLPVPAYPQGGHTMKTVQENPSSCFSKKTSSPHPLFKSLSASFLKPKPSKEWLSSKPLTALEEIEDEERREFNRTTQNVLDTENYFVKEFDKYLMHREIVELRKKEINYKKWSQRVSEPLLEAIQDFVDSKSSEEIEGRRRMQLTHYLNYCNKKGHVFLDVYDRLEYDPFLHYRLYSPYCKVSTPFLNDPLIREFHEKLKEERIVLRCIKERKYSDKEIDELHKPKLPLVPLGRQDPKAVEWLRTSSGFIESDIRQRSRRKYRGTFNGDVLDFKTQGETKSTPELFNKEMHIQPKRKCLNYPLHFTPSTKEVALSYEAKLAAT